LPLAWEVGPTSQAAQPPSALVPAEVPGAVQLDWARAQGLPDYWRADNYKLFAGLEDQYWLYRARLELPELGHDERVFFVCGGVDYRCRVSLEGQVLLEHEGMFSPFEIDLTDRARSGDALEILVFPAPKVRGAADDRTQARHSNKPPVSYGWDFHPRLIPLGIWQETGLEVRPACHVTDVDFRYALSDDFEEAAITVTVSTTEPADAHVSWRLLEPSGRIALSSSVPGARLKRPRLWWPNGEGAPNLYTLEVLLNGSLTRTRKVGFRRVRLLMHEGAWQEPSTFPKSRSHPPITLEVNGRVIFARGSNWVCPEIFPGTLSAESYRPLLALAKIANFNLLRCWGGAIANKEPFYEICDELGLLVWTEFQLACNNYDADGAYLDVLDQESRAIIARVRQHPSLALWCGGNELFNAWSGMTDQHLALRLLNKNCYELDRDTPFISTAPQDGMGHGDYRFRDERGREVFQIFRDAANTAYSEFGCPGPANIDVLRSFMPEAELFPPRLGTAWETHHGLGSWDQDPGTWLCQSTIESYFGPTRSLEELVQRGQLLQAEGYKCLFEEARRQKPTCAMALNWCFNEPWPSAANNSIVSWPAQPKPAYFAVAAACRLVLASARVPKFSWRAGETFELEAWILNDAPDEVDAGVLEAEIELDGAHTPIASWSFPKLAARTHARGPAMQLVLPPFAARTFELVLRVGTRDALESRYTFVRRD
jgi:beta-mannosidase